MKITSMLGRAAGVAAVAAGIAGLGLAGVASASTSPAAAPPSTVRVTPATAPVTCAFRTTNGHYLTAVGGGGRTTDVIHTDATQIGAWEKFTLIDSGDGPVSNIDYGLRTTNGHYLTAMGGGGRTTDVIHSDATSLQAWEEFTLHLIGNGWYAIQTTNGHYLTAVGGGGLSNGDTLHTDATQVGSWEEFHLTCGL